MPGRPRAWKEEELLLPHRATAHSARLEARQPRPPQFPTSLASFTTGGMRLTAELIERSRAFYNALFERELDLRGARRAAAAGVRLRRSARAHEPLTRRSEQDPAH